MIVQQWIPSANEAPPGSTEEAKFLAWLGEECRIREPRLIDQRFSSDGAPLHELMTSIAGSSGVLDVDWAAEWPTLSTVPWPSLHDLAAVFVNDPTQPLPHVVTLHLALFDGLQNQLLPTQAYLLLDSDGSTTLGDHPSLSTLIDNMATAQRYVDQAHQVSDTIKVHAQRVKDLRNALELQMQLLQWLVNKWLFREAECHLEALKRCLAEFEATQLCKLAEVVGQATKVFEPLEKLDGGGELLGFVQHFLKCGSVLFQPLLDHFAEGLSARRSRMRKEVSFDIATLGDLLKRCHKDLRTLSLGPSDGSSTVDLQFWSVVIRVFTKDAGAMSRELDMFFDFFAPVEESRTTTSLGQLIPSSQTSAADRPRLYEQGRNGTVP
jgi:hypothetical protein